MEQPAGFGVRFVALILDSILVSIPLGLITSFMFHFPADHNPVYDLLNFLYNLLVPVMWSGYVVGKRIVGIRILKTNGENVHIGTMFLRIVVAGIVYAITLGIGVIVSAFMVGMREDKRAIHDFIAGTYVTYQKPDELEEV